MAEAKHRKVVLEGKVVSASMNKTINVCVYTLMKHPIYGKYVTKNKKFFAHDEKEIAGVGDKVRIVECRPLSKNKRWRLLEILVKAHENVGEEVGQ